MSNKEFQKMLDLFSELDVLLKKYESSMKTEETANPSPILIPDDVYDEICARLAINEIHLLGIS